MSLRNMTYDDVVESINSGKAPLFDIIEFAKINKNLRNFQSYYMSVALIDPSSMSSFGLDVEEKTFSTIRNEIDQKLDKGILSKLFETRKFEYIDFRDSGGILMGTNTYTNMYKLYDLLMNCKEDYTNIVTTGMLANIFMDMSSFIPETHTISINKNPGRTYKIGKISGLDIWVDPYMKFNDGRMVLFKSVDINIEKVGGVDTTTGNIYAEINCTL